MFARRRASAVVAALAAFILAVGLAGPALAQQSPDSRGGDSPSSGGSGSDSPGSDRSRFGTTTLRCADGTSNCGAARPRGSGGILGIFPPLHREIPLEERRYLNPAAAPQPRVISRPAAEPVAPKRQTRRAASAAPRPGVYTGANIPVPEPRPPLDIDLAAGPVGEFVPDEVLVTLTDEPGAAQAVADAFGLEIRAERSSGLLGGEIVRYGIPDGRPVETVIAQLATDPRTLVRVPNHLYTLQQSAAIASYAFQRIALDSAAASGEGVSIGVVDSGVDEGHPALEGVLAGVFDAMPDSPVADRDHGTSISGLIAGRGLFQGIAPGARIFHARAFEGGRSTMDVLLAALDWAAAQRVDIVNMSFVGPRNDLMRLACDNARSAGHILVAAAGNAGPGAPYGYPAAYESVIAVTATDRRDALMPQANRGAYIFLSAPGVDLVAPVPGGGSDVVTGTSFAAAVASGAIANILRGAPDRSPDAIGRRLAETAMDLGEEGHDEDFGHGLLNAEALFVSRD